MTTAIIIIIAILLAVYNGQFITDQSAAWHLTGFVIRLLLGVMFVWKHKGLDFWFRATLFVTLTWTVYDSIIALMMGMPWNYIGVTSFIDVTIPVWLNQISKFIIAFAALTLGSLKTERLIAKK
jgi:hypothetical protein